MKILLDANKVAVFFEDAEPIRLEADGCYIGAAVFLGYNSSNAELVDVPPPEIPLPNCYKREADAWVAVDQAQIDAFKANLLAKHKEKIRAARQAAFVAEADPLFFKWQRGEGTEEAWLEKVAEIRFRFPSGSKETQMAGLIPITEF